MSKQELEIRANEVISQLKDMFGEGIEFECTDCFKTNETLTGISIQLPRPFAALVIYMEDMPEDASVDEIANICAVKLQEALRDIASGQMYIPSITRENILENVVLQVLSRKRNRQLLRKHPHILCMDLAGIFRIPIGKYCRQNLSTMLISNQMAEKLGLTVDELMAAARKNTVEKFGVQLISARDLQAGRPPEPFEDVQMTQPCLYTLSNLIEVNGAALMFIPEILEQVGQKAGTDYFIIPSSIHDILIARDDGRVIPQRLRELLFEGNRNPDLTGPKDVLSDNIYRYNRQKRELKIV